MLVLVSVCIIYIKIILNYQPLAETLLIKRKYKVNASGSITKWWYVVRGEKRDVELLERSGKVFPHTLAGD